MILITINAIFAYWITSSQNIIQHLFYSPIQFNMAYVHMLSSVVRRKIKEKYKF